MDLPRLRPDQWAIAQHPAKTKVLSMGRRWGKTVLGGALVGLTLAQHGRVAWIAPGYKNTRPMWRWLLAATAPDARARRITVNKSERTIETARGGFLGIYSGDNIDSIRGESFHLVVMDEAARLPEDAWMDAIMPTLADFDGDAVLISTPKGKNWFYSEWMRGQVDGVDVASWTAPTSDNPMPTIRAAVEKARLRVPELTYRQEWLAQFVDDGQVFRRVTEAVVPRSETYNPAHAYVMGCDWGRSHDFTVLTVLDVNTNAVVAIDRFNQIDYVMQVGRLKALAEQWKPYVIIAESNSMGQVVIDMLQRENLPVRPFQTTNATKAQAVDSLVLAFERGEISIPDDKVLVSELQAFEMERLPSGLIRYSAPAGWHDDCVMSLALAWQGAAGTGPLLL